MRKVATRLCSVKEQIPSSLNSTSADVRRKRSGREQSAARTRPLLLGKVLVVPPSSDPTPHPEAVLSEMTKDSKASGTGSLLTLPSRTNPDPAGPGLWRLPKNSLVHRHLSIWHPQISVNNGSCWNRKYS